MNQILEYWQQLTTRERILVSIGGGLLVLILIYTAVIEPLANGRAELEDVVTRTQQTHQAIQQAVAEAQLLRKGGLKPQQSLGGAQSMMGRIDESARRFGLGGQMKRVEPTGKDNLGIWLEKADFDKLAAWLETLEREYGLQVQTLEAERTGTGQVNARVVLGP